MMFKRLSVLIMSVVLATSLVGCGDVGTAVVDAMLSAEPAYSVLTDDVQSEVVQLGDEGPIVYDQVEIPAWDGENAYYVLNNDEPWFEESDRTRTDAFETYSELDAMGRCGVAYANVCPDLQPTEARGEIGSVRPSGWHTVRYNDLISGNYLYNRCHLIGFQLAGENANPMNLITGTRYLNIDGMLGFENEVDDYVDETGNHVLYRVTPVYDGDDLVARGVVMEAYSVEDAGTGVRFCVFAYNNQPGVGIDYATGNSWRLDGRDQDEVEAEAVYGVKRDFVLNTKSGKFHLPECRYASQVSSEYRVDAHETLQTMLDAGYDACGVCHPDEVA